MKVVVTGGSGKVGRAVVHELLSAGNHLTVVDRISPNTSLTPFLFADLTEYGEVVDALSGADAVAHLAAIPAQRIYSDPVTFRNNAVSDYNVFQACRQLGIRNVVWASSETILGLPFDTPPAYVPLDEDSPRRPESAYSLAKLVTETMAEQFCRWDSDLKIFGMRFSNVMEPADYARFPAFDATPEARKWNLWCYIDARDAAQAVRLGLESKLTGAEVFVIANADSVMSRSSQSLMDEYFPDVEVRCAIEEQGAWMSHEKAARLLGFKPRYSWRNEI